MPRRLDPKTLSPRGRRGLGRPPRQALARLWRGSSGTTAIEFAMIAPLLLMLLMGTVEFGMLFASDILLKDATYQAARTGRTGYVSEDSTQEADILARIKSEAGVLMDTSKISITSKAYADYNVLNSGEPYVDANGNGKRDDGESFTDINGNGVYDDGAVTGYGGTSEVVTYTVTYPWTFFTPFIGELMTDGGTLTLTARAVVQNEPY